jgi:hypothetical protein
VAVGPPDPAGHDVVINATPLGMRPGDPLPVTVSRLAPGSLVCDIVTRPPQTRLLAEAAARGCVPHPGLPMLAGQVDLILDFLGLSGTGQFHDRERFDTAGSTKSFAIIECGDGGRLEHVPGVLRASICITATSCVTFGGSSRMILSA